MSNNNITTAHKLLTHLKQLSPTGTRSKIMLNDSDSCNLSCAKEIDQPGLYCYSLRH